MKILNAVYDLSVNPLTFDVMNFLAISTMVMKINKMDGFHLHIMHGPWRKATPKDNFLNDNQRNLRVKTIIEPMARLCKYCVGYTVHKERTQIEHPTFPPRYDINSPTTNVLLRNVFPLIQHARAAYNLNAAAGYDFLTDILDSSPEYDEIVRKHYPEPPVLATGRASTTEATKNTKVDWGAVCEATGAVWVRDTDEVFGDRAVHPADNVLASVDLEYRFALQKYAKLCVSDSGGPNFLPFLTRDTNCRVFLSSETYDLVDNQDSKRRAMLMGLEFIGDQWPYTQYGNNKFEWYKGELTTDKVVDTIKTELLECSN